MLAMSVLRLHANFRFWRRAAGGSHSGGIMPNAAAVMISSAVLKFTHSAEVKSTVGPIASHRASIERSALAGSRALSSAKLFGLHSGE